MPVLRLNKSLATVIVFAAGTLSGCTGGETASAPKDALVVVGDKILSSSDIRQVLPPALPVDDSISFARAYIRSWIETQLLSDKAESIVDMEEIDRLTREYRDQLTASRFRAAMAANATDGIFSDDSLEAFYNRNRTDFKLQRPLIKGIYIKIPDDAPNLAAVRRLYKSENTAEVDRLDKSASKTAIHYDYFRDRWVDSEQLENRIPVSADVIQSHISKKTPLDISSDGFVYLLSTSDYIPAGDLMPFEAAKPLIRERLLARKRIEYDRQLREDLFNTSIADGTVKFPNFNPLK